MANRYKRDVPYLIRELATVATHDEVAAELAGVGDGVLDTLMAKHPRRVERRPR